MQRLIKSFSSAVFLISALLCISCRTIRQPSSVPEPLNYSDDDIVQNEIGRIDAFMESEPVRALWRAKLLGREEVIDRCFSNLEELFNKALEEEKYLDAKKYYISLQAVKPGWKAEKLYTRRAQPWQRILHMSCCSTATASCSRPNSGRQRSCIIMRICPSRRSPSPGVSPGRPCVTACAMRRMSCGRARKNSGWRRGCVRCVRALRRSGMPVPGRIPDRRKSQRLSARDCRFYKEVAADGI